MEFTTLEDTKTSELTHQGYIGIEFDTLFEKLGEPNEGDGEKTDAEWVIEFADKTIATIYNYENGVNYRGTSGLSVSDIIVWNIGGADKAVVDRVHELFVVA